MNCCARASSTAAPEPATSTAPASTNVFILSSMGLSLFPRRLAGGFRSGKSRRSCPDANRKSPSAGPPGEWAGLGQP